MSSSSGPTSDRSNHRTGNHSCGSWGKSGNWSGLNIAAMVLGFVFFWPLGLVILYWIIKGRDVKELPQSIRQQWESFTGSWRGSERAGHGGWSDNAVFNDYQQTQHDRIREIKGEIKERARRFREFRADAKRRADEEEFNRFMADTPRHTDG